MKKSIGGFFELELTKEKSYHEGALALNSARNGLEYLIYIKKIQKIYLPYYICDSVLQTLKKCNVLYEFYSIDEKLNPLYYPKLNEGEFFLYVNYFGIKTEIAKKISNKLHNVIINNTQAFFEKPFKQIDTLYSPRKFFGVVDGGYLYTKSTNLLQLPKEKSYNRMQYILKAIDEDTESAYELFRQNESYLNDCELKLMSNLTQNILRGIDYESIRKKRNINFNYIHEQLGYHNLLMINLENLNAPMAYPLWTRNGKRIKEELIKQKIFVATYWHEVRQKVHPSSIEYRLTEDLIPLPIDQRYTLEDMKAVVEIFNKIIKEGSQ